MSNEYSRNQRDAAFSTKFNVPAAAGSGSSASFDLGQRIGGEIEQVDAEIVIPALTALVDTKKVSITVQDSPDDSSWANIDPQISTSVVGANTPGADAKTVRFRFPPQTRRYVRLAVAVDSGAGDNTAEKIGFNLLF